jgi:hypothetical protein
MLRTAVVLWALLLAGNSVAQMPLASPKEPPQSARQALLEAFFGQTPDHLERHLPELAKKAFRQLDSGTGNQGLLTQISTMGMEMKRSSNHFQTMDTGPTLLVAAEPGGADKFEINVERDDLVGEENVIELSFHMYKQGKEQGLPVIPRLAFSLKTEADVWRIYDAQLTVRAPIGDPDFLKTLMKNLLEQQQSTNEMWATISLRAIAGAETVYQSTSATHAFTCSLSQLVEASKPKDGEFRGALVDDELATGKKKGYVFALTGCDALHFKAVAEPATPTSGRRAFCTDESNTIRFSRDGKGTTCVSHGEAYEEQVGLSATAHD